MTGYDMTAAPEHLHAMLLPVWRQLLQSTDISIDDDFFETGGDSLLAKEFILQLGDILGRDVPETLLFETSTIRTLADRLCATAELRRQIVVKVGAAATDEPPLIFFHGDWTSGGFYVKHLASRLAPDLSLVAVAPHGTPDEPVPNSIEAMAADRLPEILKAYPSGPYRLGGHCIGAIVALETARLLMAAQNEVEIVVMVDPPLVVGGKWSRMPVDAVPPRKRFEVREAATALEDMPVAPESASSLEAERRYGKALEAYSPAPLPVRLILFMSENDGRPWCALSAESELVVVPGDHFEWITSRAYAFAARVKARLTRIRFAEMTAQLDEARRQRDVAQQQWEKTLESTTWRIACLLRSIGACLPPGVRRGVRHFVRKMERLAVGQGEPRALTALAEKEHRTDEEVG